MYMVNLKNEYVKYKKARLQDLSNFQYINRESELIKDKIFTKKISYMVNNDSQLAQAIHSAAVYRKLVGRYNVKALSRNNINNAWKKKQLPRVIWWCWFQGEENIPELAKICLDSLRKHMPSYKITIITLENLTNYIIMPDFILRKFRAGWISGATFSDIIRLALLARYGGIWIDATVYCSDNRMIKLIENNNMFMYQNVLSSNSNVIKMSSWLMATKKGNPYIIEAHKLLMSYYKNTNYTEDYFLCHLILTMLIKKYPTIWNDMDIANNVNPHMLQHVLNNSFSEQLFNRIINKSSFHKLNRHIQFKKGDTFYNHLKSEDNL